MFGGAELAAGHLSRQFWPIQVEDHASLVLTLPGGAPASVNLSLCSWQSRMEITVETEKAQFLLRGRGKFYGSQRLTIVTKWPWLQPDQPRETLFDYGMEDVSLQQETEEFVIACTNPNAGLTIATAADALQSMRIVDACYVKLKSKGAF
jgi:predicted dehydrogenase